MERQQEPTKGVAETAQLGLATIQGMEPADQYVYLKPEIKTIDAALQAKDVELHLKDALFQIKDAFIQAKTAFLYAQVLYAQDGGKHRAAYPNYDPVLAPLLLHRNTKLAQRFKAMRKWMREHESECRRNKWLPLKKPFDAGLCKRYVSIQMHREIKGELLGTCNFLAIIQMLKYEGFTKQGVIVPLELDQFFKDAHELHKRRIAGFGLGFRVSIPRELAQ